MKPRELNIFFNTILFYTRVPVPKSTECTDNTLKEAFRYFTLVGLFIGALGALAYFGASMVLPFNVAIIIGLLTTLLITGAIHQDGLADFCDGFGGGKDKESILRIMKDSHIGTYGVLSLIILFLLEYALLINIKPISIYLVFICANGAARFNAVALVGLSKYARSQNSKSMHTKLGVSYKELVPALIFGYAPLFIFGYIFAIIYILIACIILWLLKNYLERKIDGFTGDTLGALIEFSKIAFYIVYIIIGKWYIY